MPSLTIKTKFILVAAASIAAVLYLAVSNTIVLRSEIADVRQSNEMARLLRRHVEADMMHDGMRADVLSALLGLQTKDAEVIAQANSDLKEHSDRFLENVRENLASNPPMQIRAALQKIEPVLRAYSADAARIVDAAGADLKAGTSTAAQLRAPFEASFTALETAQENTTTLIEKYMADTVSGQESRAEFYMIQAIVASIVALIFVGSIPVTSHFLLFAPLSRLIEVMGALSRAERSVLVPFQGRSDEVGEMSAALLVFQRNADEKVRMERDRDAQKAAMETERRNAVLQLASNFESQVGELVKNVAAAASELQATSSSMTQTSQIAIEQAGSVAQASEQMAHNANTVAAATEELSASFGEINQRMMHSTEVIKDAVSQTQETSSHVKRLDEAARKIGEVVKLISDIAEQTNLLALNATIEAARAGDAGKGFAVVASEVKALANQTAKATEEVENQIKAIQGAVQESSKAMTAVTGSIEKVRDISTAIAGAIEEQSAATLSIASNVAETSRASNETKVNIEGVLRASEGAGTAAGEVLSAAEELSRNGELLTQQVERFLREVRSSK